MLVVDPRDDQRLVADLGRLVFSSDGGRTLRPIVASGVGHAFAQTAYFSRDQRSIFLPATQPKDVIGVLSRDGGATWRGVPAKGLTTAGALTDAEAAMDPTGMLVAAPNLLKDHSLRISRDDGATWQTTCSATMGTGDDTTLFARVRFVPTRAGVLALWGDSIHWWASTDLGRTRVAITPLPGGAFTWSSFATISLNDGAPLLSDGSSTAISLSEDGAVLASMTFAPRRGSAPGSVVAVDRARRFWYLVKDSTLLRSHDGGRTWFRAPSLPPPMPWMGNLLLRTGEVAYTSSAGIVLAFADDRSGAHPLFTVAVALSVNLDPMPHGPLSSVAAQASGPLRECRWSDPDPRDPRKLLAWDGFSLLASSDGGENFARLGAADLLRDVWPGLTPRPEVLSVQRERDSDLIFIEARQGAMIGLLSLNGGRQFRSVPGPDGLPTASQVRTVLAKGELVTLASGSTQVYRSSTHGQSWRAPLTLDEEGDTCLLRVNNAAVAFTYRRSAAGAGTLSARDVVGGSRLETKVPGKVDPWAILTSGLIVEDGNGLLVHSSNGIVHLAARRLQVEDRPQKLSLRALTRDPANAAVYFALVAGTLQRSGDDLRSWTPAVAARPAALWSATLVSRTVAGATSLFYVADDGRIAQVPAADAFPPARKP